MSSVAQATLISDDREPKPLLIPGSGSVSFRQLTPREIVDPKTSATLTLPKIKQLVDAMVEAHEPHLRKSMRLTGRMMYSALSETCETAARLQNAA